MVTSEMTVDSNTGKTQLASFDHSNNFVAINMKMMSLSFVKIIFYKMLGLPFSSSFDSSFYIDLMPELTLRNNLSLFYRC